MTHDRPPDRERQLAAALDAVRRYADNPDISPYLEAIRIGEAAASPDPAEMNLHTHGPATLQASLLLLLEASRVVDAIWIVDSADAAATQDERVPTAHLASDAGQHTPESAFTTWQAMSDASRLLPLAEPRLQMRLERRGDQVWGTVWVTGPVCRSASAP